MRETIQHRLKTTATNRLETEASKATTEIKNIIQYDMCLSVPKSEWMNDIDTIACHTHTHEIHIFVFINDAVGARSAAAASAAAITTGC